MKLDKIIEESVMKRLISKNIIIATGSSYKTAEGINVIPFDKINFLI
jgi:hypothetical protein